MFNNVDEARQELHVAVGIIDDYVRALNTKDATILRLTKENDELEEQNRKLRGVVFAELPEKAEVSQ